MGSSDGFPLDLMADLVRELDAGSGDWRQLLLDPRFERLRDRDRWFNDRQKGMFYRLMSSPQRNAFLEIQAGSGIVSACLSEDYERGYAFEHRPVLADFIGHRFRTDGIRNVEVMRMDACSLPLADGSVDLVVIDAPLAAGAFAPGPADAEAAGLSVLREARRCLGPEGRLIMAVDNAWGGSRRLGPAERSGDFGHEGGRMRARNAPAYCRLLRNAGFRNARVFVVKTCRQLPIDIYSFHRESLEQLYGKYYSRSRAARFVMWACKLARLPFLAAYFQPSFYLVGDAGRRLTGGTATGS